MTLVTLPEATSLQVCFCVSACHRTELSCWNSKARMRKQQAPHVAAPAYAAELVKLRGLSVMIYRAHNGQHMQYVAAEPPHAKDILVSVFKKGLIPDLLGK